MVRGDHKDFPVPVLQIDATLSHGAPVSAGKYVALDTTKNVRIYGIMVSVTWTVQPTPLELHATIDGIAVKWSKIDPVSATPYFAHINPALPMTAQNLSDAAAETTRQAFLIEGRSIKIEAATTGGTVSNLSAKVIYAKW